MIGGPGHGYTTVATDGPSRGGLKPANLRQSDPDSRRGGVGVARPIWAGGPRPVADLWIIKRRRCDTDDRVPGDDREDPVADAVREAEAMLSPAIDHGAAPSFGSV